MLKNTSIREAFHFYTNYGKPLAISSSSLQDFCKKTSYINSKSLEFHVRNGHFAAWVKFLGDSELAERLNQLQSTVRTGEPLRNTIYTLIKQRFDELLGELQTIEPSK